VNAKRMRELEDHPEKITWEDALPGLIVLAWLAAGAVYAAVWAVAGVVEWWL